MTKPASLDRYIYWSHHSDLLSFWNIFERYIKRKAEIMGLNAAVPLDRCYKDVLSERGVENPKYQWAIDEFELIRLTRNSLHSGGMYTRTKPRHGSVCGIQYSLAARLRIA